MYLYLVRHAIAVERDAPGVTTDAERALTPEGRIRMRRNVNGLKRLKVSIDEIWTSPLVRARQTAEVLAEGYALNTAIQEEAALEPGGEVATLVQRLCERPLSSRIALVGHEPYLGELATYLLTGLWTGSIRFKKGGVACIKLDCLDPPIRGELRWLLAPRQLKSIR